MLYTIRNIVQYENIFMLYMCVYVFNYNYYLDIYLDIFTNL